VAPKVGWRESCRNRRQADPVGRTTRGPIVTLAPERSSVALPRIAPPGGPMRLGWLALVVAATIVETGYYMLWEAR
jgi:hypothetical protein